MGELERMERRQEYFGVVGWLHASILDKAPYMQSTRSNNTQFTRFNVEICKAIL